MDGIDITQYIKTPQLSDVNEILQIFTDVTKWLRSMGVLQWDFTYPNTEIISQDIISNSCLVVQVDKEIAAVVSLNQEQDPQYKKVNWMGGEENIWVIHRLAVNGKFQNQGIATQFCNHLENLARAQGAKAIRLDAYCENPYSNRMYQKLGYQLMKEQLYFHGNEIGFNAYEKILT